MLKAAGFVARSEVMVVEGTSKRMDIVVTLPTEVLWIDVSVINPTAPSYLKRKEPAHEIRAGVKNSRWNKHAQAKGYTFIPAIFETYGAMGEDLDVLIKSIAEKAW